jgi:hypothetical protein
MKSSLHTKFATAQMHQYPVALRTIGDASEMGCGQPGAHVQAGHTTMCPSQLGALLAFALDSGNVV